MSEEEVAANPEDGLFHPPFRVNSDSDSFQYMTREEAEENGYEPCQMCY